MNRFRAEWRHNVIAKSADVIEVAIEVDRSQKAVGDPKNGSDWR